MKQMFRAENLGKFLGYWAAMLLFVTIFYYVSSWTGTHLPAAYDTSVTYLSIIYLTAATGRGVWKTWQ